MKAIQFRNLTTLLLALVVITSCVQDDEFSTPNISITEPVLSGPVITIDAVAGFLAQEMGGAIDYSDETTSFTFEETNNYVEGYVISSDEAGNFFEELLLQDKSENPTVGLKVIIDENPLFTRYDMGRKIYVKLDGLSVGITNGVLTLGVLNGNEVDQIPGPQELEFITRSSEVATLVPLPLDIQSLDDSMTNMYVTLQDVQFRRNQVVIDNPMTFAAEPLDEFDGERILEDCSTGASVIFSTSTFADFKGLELPVQRGSMNAILTKNFFGDEFNIVVNSASDITFDNAERCDPDFLECETPSGGGGTFWSEDFEGFGGYAAEGWTNVNVSGGSLVWITGNFAGNSYAQISGFNTNEDFDVWLVTPAINLDGTTGEELSFDVQTNFNNGDILTVFVSSNFTGDPLTADWEALDVIIPAGSSTGFGNFEPVGPVNISCLDGDVHFGFFYSGSDPGPTTRYHVDNLDVTGN